MNDKRRGVGEKGGVQPTRRAIFPVGPVAIGHVAEATLRSVRRGDGEIVAVYGLAAKDEPSFVERMEAVRGATEFQYAPVPGFWATYRVHESEDADEDDAFEFIVGYDLEHLDEQIGTMRRLKVERDSVVPSFVIRSLALGYLQRVGA